MCPLCHQAKHMPKAKPLYDKMVCKKCYYKFTNRRQIAYIIDAILWNIISYFVGIAFALFVVSIVPTISSVQLFWAGTAFGYLIFLIFACKDGFGGHSIGKMITGVQVVDDDSYQPIGFGKSFRRNLCLAIPFAVLFIGVQMAKGKRLGDRWANTRVIWKKFRDHPVFTGAPLDSNESEFLAGDGQDAENDANPFAAPRD